jgi:hypothetical protein
MSDTPSTDFHILVNPENGLPILVGGCQIVTAGFAGSLERELMEWKMSSESEKQMRETLERSLAAAREECKKLRELRDRVLGGVYGERFGETERLRAKLAAVSELMTKWQEHGWPKYGDETKQCICELTSALDAAKEKP